MRDVMRRDMEVTEIVQLDVMDRTPSRRTIRAATDKRLKEGDGDFMCEQCGEM